MHHRQRQRDVCTGVDRDVPIGARGSARPVRIDHNQLGAIASRLFNKGPKMDVVAMNVRGPGNYVFRLAELLGLGTHVHAINRLDAGGTGFRANGSSKLRRANGVKKTAIH